MRQPRHPTGCTNAFTATEEYTGDFGDHRCCLQRFRRHRTGRRILTGKRLPKMRRPETRGYSGFIRESAGPVHSAFGGRIELTMYAVNSNAPDTMHSEQE